MKKILLCLLMLISLKGFTQANYQLYKVTIEKGLYFKMIPASALPLDSAVYMDRTAGLQVRKVPAAGVTDTTNKWLNDIRRRPGTDTVEKFKNGSWQFAYKDSIGGGVTSINSMTGLSQIISGGAGIDVSSSSDVHTVRINTTLDAQVSDANNTGTSATDLYSKTIAANQLTLNGHSIHFEAAGVNNDATATVNLEALFAGNGIAGAGAVTITSTGPWSMRGTIIRATSTTARVYTVLTIENSTQQVFSTTANLTGIDWTTTNILKIQATAGGAGGGSNDITAQMWKVVFQP